jgi:hypothetical protein
MVFGIGFVRAYTTTRIYSYLTWLDALASRVTEMVLMLKHLLGTPDNID